MIDYLGMASPEALAQALKTPGVYRIVAVAGNNNDAYRVRDRSSPNA